MDNTHTQSNFIKHIELIEINFQPIDIGDCNVVINRFKNVENSPKFYFKFSSDAWSADWIEPKKESLIMS